MERHFEQELDKLNRRVLKMAVMASDQVGRAMEALINCDTELAENIIEADIKLDELDVKIDKLCQRIFALTQPVATDLRLIMSSLKLNNDLERMGDLAVSIAKKIEGISGFKDIIEELHIDELAVSTSNLVKDVVQLLNSRQTVLIGDIFNASKEIKQKNRAISNQIIEKMMEKSDVVVVATNLVIILTHIERIAGYCSNIAESVVFIVEGKIIKHSHKGDKTQP
ncbi:MAG: phosphate signaling complex protein PhoU [Bacteroidota bacterium]|nr:phosphate signaling complex protein PhoU [Bacteroidota bacterium]